MRKLIKQIRPDIIVSMPEEVSGKALASLLGVKVPIVVSERNNPWIMPKSKINRLLRKIFYPISGGIVFQTEQASRFFSKKVRRKGIIIPNPIDISCIPNNITTERRKEIVTVGRLEKQKNHKLLIRAFAIFQKANPDYKLIIYGEGKLRQELEEYAAVYLLENSYSFPGVKKDVLYSIKNTSLFVLSSDYEGMPNALMEAMAIGLPVISTDCPAGGPASLIQNEKNGLLVPINNEEKLAETIAKIVNNPSFAVELGNNAMRIRKSHNSEAIAEKWRHYLWKVWFNRKTSLEKQ